MKMQPTFTKIVNIDVKSSVSLNSPENVEFFTVCGSKSCTGDILSTRTSHHEL